MSTNDFYMKEYVRHTRGRMYQSDFFEFFSKVHPSMPFAFWIPIGLGFLGYHLNAGTTTLAQTAAFFPLGFLSWQLMEYFIHKHLFHTFPGWTGHGFHHKYPDDDNRLVMPLPVSIVLAAFFGGLLYLLHAPEATVPGWTGLLAGYLWYDYLHWSTHHGVFRTEWGKNLRAHHMAHHFGDSDKNFGISHMWMDKLLGSVNSRTADKK